jgi:tetratricopeptide (TPR) repeat protein
VSGSVVRERLVGALDRLLRAEHSAAVRAALQALDPDPFRDAFRDAERDKDAAALVKLAGQAEALQQPAGFTAFLGESKAISVERRRAVLETAVQLRPGDLGLLMTLGNSYPLDQREGAEERARWFQGAVAAAPTNCVAHDNLGTALQDKGDMDRAIAEYRQAIRLDPKFAWPHYNLGLALSDKGNLDGAIAEYHQAIQLDPKFAWPHHNLGWMLYIKRDLDGAIAEYQEAIRLDPKDALPHNNLGLALSDKGDLDGAIAEYHQAIQLDRKSVSFQIHLRHAQRMRELLPRLTDVLAGKEQPKSPAEGCDFADLCTQPFQKRYAEAARLFAGAFAADPRLADDLKAGQRYNAACSAALAGCGQGRDGDKRDDRERARLRGQALHWLRADLVLHRRQAGPTEAAQRREVAAPLTHWLEDTDLAGVRPGPGQVAMPAEERAAWGALWADLKATLADARKLTPPTGSGKK